jgi:MprA protease rhombosortase-interaction domain-containing protein
MTSQTAQDQLIVIPLPTGGALALAGLAGIAIRRRR